MKRPSSHSGHCHHGFSPPLFRSVVFGLADRLSILLSVGCQSLICLHLSCVIDFSGATDPGSGHFHVWRFVFCLALAQGQARWAQTPTSEPLRSAAATDTVYRCIRALAPTHPCTVVVDTHSGGQGDCLFSKTHAIQGGHHGSQKHTSSSVTSCEDSVPAW